MPRASVPAVPAPGSSTHWPLTVLLAGLPLWWVLGVDSLLPVLLAVPMGVRLLRRRIRVVPRGFGWWLLFLVWVALGVTVLWADAPGAVPGGDSSRLLVYGYRAAWYAACTVVLLWAANVSRDELPDEHVRRLVAWLFVVATAGGLLGLLAPDWEVRSLVELLLPGNLAGNPFVSSLVHPQAADVQEVLGRAEPRPKAPFPYTNTWGSCVALSLVAMVALDLRRFPVLRVGRVVVIGAALVPIAYSLNRALWVTIAVGLVAVLALALVRGRATRVLPALVAGVAVVGILAVGPLGGLVQDRLDSPHSNDRRGSLAVATTESVTQGAPLVGFGSTRDVQGGFGSIAAADSPDCPACGAPPLGTQGLGWTVLFAHGWPGLLFFLAFVLLALARSWRCRTTTQAVAAFTVAAIVLQLPFYDTLGLPLYLVMLAVGLAAREHAGPDPRPRLAGPLSRVTHRLGRRRALAAVLVPVALGTGAGVSWVALSEASYAASRAVQLAPRADPVRPSTIDTQAVLVLGRDHLDVAAARAGTTPETLLASTTVTARPGTDVLDVTVSAADPASARDRADAIVETLPDAGTLGRPVLLGAAETRAVARPWTVATASGLGLGLLAGVALLRLLARRPLHGPARAIGAAETPEQSALPAGSRA